METELITTLLTTTITKLTMIVGLVGKIPGVKDVQPEIITKLKKAISALTEALAIINALPLDK